MLTIIIEILACCFYLFSVAGQTMPAALPGGEAAPSANLSPAAGEDDPAAAFEKARILETVDGEYEKALEAYAALRKRHTGRDASILEKAELGSVRCLIKLGKKAEASALLEEMKGRSLSPATAAAVDRHSAWLSSQDSTGDAAISGNVNNLVLELLEGAGDANEDRAKTAMGEIEKMGSLAVPTLIEAATESVYFESVASFKLLVNIATPEAVAFLRACASDPDTALRKRCLDGILRGSIRSPVRESLLIRYLGDREEAFLSVAMDALTSSARLENVEEDLRFMGEKIAEFLRSDNQEISAKAWICLNAILTRNRNRSVEGLPVDLLAPVIEEELDRFLPPREMSSMELERLVEAMQMAQGLYMKYGQDRFREKIAQFWPVRRSADSHSYRMTGLLCAATECLPADALNRLVDDLTADKNSAGRCRFGDAVPLKTFQKLTAGTQKNFLDVWAREMTVVQCPSLWNDPEAWLPSSWAAVVTALLERRYEKTRPVLFQWIDDCPDPTDPACIEALAQWAADPELKVQKACFQLLENQLKAKKIDPGKTGMLKILGRAFELIGEPLVLTRYETEYRIAPERAHTVFRMIPECMKQGDVVSVCEWIRQQPFPGFHDGIMGLSITARPILEANRDFAASLWPGVSPLAKEAYFFSFFRAIHRSLSSAKPDWFVPALADLDFSMEWRLENAENLVGVLNCLDEPSLDPLTRDLVDYLFKNSEHFSTTKVWQMGQLLGKAAPRSEIVREIIPIWYEKISAKIIKQNGPHLRNLFLSSPACLRQGLEWLVEDHGDFFAETAFEAIEICSREKPDLIRTVAAEGMLNGIWDRCDAKTRASLVVSLAGSKLIFRPFVQFAESILLAADVDAHVKHFVYAGLLYSGEEGAAGTLMKYISSLEAGEADKPLDGPFSGPADLAVRTGKIFAVLLGTNDALLRAFGNEAKQRLSREILSLPVRHPRLRNTAARIFRIENDQDLDFALRTMGDCDEKLPCAGLFSGSVDYLMVQARKSGKETNDGGTSPLSPELCAEAKKLVARALGGVGEEDRISGVASQAISAVATYDFVDMIPLVGRTAVNDSSWYTRLGAVKCLGSFRNVETVPYLVECLKDPYEDVLEAAREYLRRMRDYEEQKRAWEAFMGKGTFDGTASPATALIKMLESDNSAVRLAAIKSLGKLGDVNTLPVLVKIIAEGTPEERAAATDAVDAITAE